jgi:steroid 5-alpha reductase family enzyme
LVWLWAIRLTANWATFWGGLQHEDWRYPLVRGRAGRFEFLADFFGIHFYPTVQGFLACLPIYAVMTRGQAPLGWLDAVAVVVTFGAIAIETIADLQLHAFIKTRKPGTFIQTGLWGWSRHPNYFGEISFWWGLMLFGLVAAPEQWWWIVPGALSMTAMFLFASIPFMDNRSLERRPAYAEYMKKVPALVPLPPRH